MTYKEILNPAKNVYETIKVFGIFAITIVLLIIGYLAEIFTSKKEMFGTKNTADKIRFYSVFVIAGLAFGFAYGLAPFFYSNEYLMDKTTKDVLEFAKSDKFIEDTRFSFLKKVDKKDGCFLSTAVSKYTPFSITKISCEGGQK